MISENQKQSRRRFIAWGVASAAMYSAFRILIPGRRKKMQQSKTVKMLSQDGKLVEVEIAGIPRKGKKVTNRELQNWIRRKNKSI
jgi:hypothetical protein